MHVGDVIEPAVRHCKEAYYEFFNSIKACPDYKCGSYILHSRNDGYTSRISFLFSVLLA